MTLLLIANRESMIVDPINWESFRSRLRAMSRGWNSGGLSVPEATDAIFRERVSLRHAPRKRQPPEEILRVLGTRSLYSFFDAYSPSLPIPNKVHKDNKYTSKDTK